MTPFRPPFFPAVLAAVVLLAAGGCDREALDPAASDGGSSSGPTTVTITNSGTTFTPSAVTIVANDTVIWDIAPGHTLAYETTAGTQACSATFSSFPVTQTFTAAGTYYFHCTFHSSCTGTTCGACTGMAGQVVVQ